MGEPLAISIRGLGKRYRLGQTVDLRRTFRETLMGLPGFLGQRLRRRFARRGLAAPQAEPADPDTPHGTFWALRDVNLDVHPGEVVGIVGRNGSGKSTLLKILSRITSPTAGEAEIRGRLASLLEVGTGFHPELTGRENIYLNGVILGMKRAEIDRRFDEIVDFAEIEQFLDTPVKRYSSGMYVRLAFAVAAHLEPDILLVDEVLAVGDLAFQKKCLGKMGEVGRLGRTVLVVSHNMQIVASLCERVCWLDKGIVRAQGSVHEVLPMYERESRSTSVYKGTRILRSEQLHPKHTIDWVEILDGIASQHTTVFRNGATIHLYVALRQRPLPAAAYFEWALYTDQGSIASSGGTFTTARAPELPPRSGVLHAVIGPIENMAQGQYSLTLTVGVLPGHILDRWEELEVITITDCVTPGGMAFDSRRGVLHIPESYED